jgi:hypothetical protein
MRSLLLLEEKEQRLYTPERALNKQRVRGKYLAELLCATLGLSQPTPRSLPTPPNPTSHFRYLPLLYQHWRITTTEQQ